MDLPDELKAIAAKQRGVVHRRQLYAHGLTREQVRWAVGRRWTAVLPGVVALFTGQLDDVQRARAAALYAGDDATLTGIEAARRHRLKYLPAPGVFEFFVPDRRCERRAGFVHVSPSVRHDSGARSLEGILVASPARAVVDAAPCLPDQGSIYAVVLQVVQRRLATLATLRHELERAPVRGSARLRMAVIEAERGAWSRPEVECLTILRSSSTLPDPQPNASLRDESGDALPRPDAWFQDVGLAVQVHSREHHADDEDDFDNTLATDARLTTAGATVIAVTPRQLRRDPQRFLTRVETTYLRLVRSGVRCPITMTSSPTA